MIFMSHEFLTLKTNSTVVRVKSNYVALQQVWFSPEESIEGNKPVVAFNLAFPIVIQFSTELQLHPARSRQAISDENLIAAIGVDADENGLFKIWDRKQAPR